MTLFEKLKDSNFDPNKWLISKDLNVYEKTWWRELGRELCINVLGEDPFYDRIDIAKKIPTWIKEQSCGVQDQEIVKKNLGKLRDKLSHANDRTKFPIYGELVEVSSFPINKSIRENFDKAINHLKKPSFSSTQVDELLKDLDASSKLVIKGNQVRFVRAYGETVFLKAIDSLKGQKNLDYTDIDKACKKIQEEAKPQSSSSFNQNAEDNPISRSETPPTTSPKTLKQMEENYYLKTEEMTKKYFPSNIPNSLHEKIKILKDKFVTNCDLANFENECKKLQLEYLQKKTLVSNAFSNGALLQEHSTETGQLISEFYDNDEALKKAARNLASEIDLYNEMKDQVGMENLGILNIQKNKILTGKATDVDRSNFIANCWDAYKRKLGGIYGKETVDKAWAQFNGSVTGAGLKEKCIQISNEKGKKIEGIFTDEGTKFLDISKDKHRSIQDEIVELSGRFARTLALGLGSLEEAAKKRGVITNVGRWLNSDKVPGLEASKIVKIIEDAYKYLQPTVANKLLSDVFDELGVTGSKALKQMFENYDGSQEEIERFNFTKCPTEDEIRAKFNSLINSGVFAGERELFGAFNATFEKKLKEIK